MSDEPSGSDREREEGAPEEGPGDGRPEAQPPGGPGRSRSRTGFADPAVARRNLLVMALGILVFCWLLPPILDSLFVAAPWLGDLAQDYDQARKRSYDTLLQVHHFFFEPRSPSQVAVVAIDDLSLERVGRWPWSRDVLADLIQGAEELGARTVAIDVLLAEPERSPARTLGELVERHPEDPLAGTTRQLLEAARRAEDTTAAAGDFPAVLARALRASSGDDRLERVMRESGRVVLGSVMNWRRGGSQASSWLNPAPGTRPPANAVELIRLRRPQLSEEQIQEAWENQLFLPVFMEEARGLPVLPLGGVGEHDVRALPDAWVLPDGTSRFTALQRIFQSFESTESHSVQLPLAAFAAAAASVGYLNDIPDRDTVVRRMSLFQPVESYPVPSLVLASIANYLDGELELWFSEDLFLEEVRVVRGQGPDRRAVDAFTCNHGARFWLDFYSVEETVEVMDRLDAAGAATGVQERTYRTVPRIDTVSAVRVLDAQEGLLNPQEREALQVKLLDRICFVGPTAVGLGDIRPTPLGYSRPGVEAHATAAANLLGGETLQRREAERKLSMALEFAFVMLLALVLPRLEPWKALVATLGLAALAFGVCVAGLHGGGVLFPFDLLLPMGLLFALGMAYLNRFENAEKAWIDGMFKRYVSAEYIEELKKNKGELSLTGKEAEITPFFSDMAKFSTISEAFSAEGLFRFLGEYLGEMADILDEYGGTLDKFEGDAVVAFFGAPIWRPDHARRACLASLRMQERIQELEMDWQTSGRYPELLRLAEKVGHWFPIRVRIGLNTGVCATGHLGTAERGNYTMMGDTVNLAARLESGGKQYGVTLTISDDTYQQASEAIVGRELDLVQVVGRTQPTRIWEIVGRRGEIPDSTQVFLDLYEEAMALYKEHRFAEAFQAFENAARRRPDDRATGIYLQRCTDFLENPPPPDWNGVCVLTEK